METPKYSHLTLKDFDNVYEPAEDSFLLLDALEDDLEFLLIKKPQICVEIGPGSGIIISALAKHLKYQSSGFFAVDINKFACKATKGTATENKVFVEVINMNLLNCFKPESVDLLVFNPPYVPTSSESTEIDKDYERLFNSLTDDKKLLMKSWAGGADGCEITNRVVFNLKNILAPNGIFYLLLLKENKPERYKQLLIDEGFQVTQVKERKIPGEHLFVFKIVRFIST
jgi:release factor glutamine methyltransferase